jgi:Carboxypeptidase regulatory-like domain/TonB dependent receptor-like, beta-barrel/TonB-dependent Receptor Plug Domain
MRLQFPLKDALSKVFRSNLQTCLSAFTCATVAVMLAFSPRASAQVDTGAIVGQVSDSTGALIPGAKVTATEVNTGIAHTTTTDGNGEYTLSPLKIGEYNLSVTKQGFKELSQHNIEVTIQSRLKVNATLEPGAVTQGVVVTGVAPLLETQTSSVQQLVSERQINDLPLNGRNASFLAQLSPGVTFAQHDSRGLQASGSFSANGFGRTENDYLLDGMDNNAYIGDLVNQTQYAIMPPPDALREFTVQTSNYSAEFGHSAGAVLNVSTRSGTNSYHGDLWEFLRNDALDAVDYFAKGKPEFRYNQFGATFGGPIFHNKTFIFVDYQGTRVVQGQTYKSTVPTAVEHNSGFTNLQDLITLQTGTTTDALARTFPKGTVFDPATTRAVTAGVTDPVTGLAATSTGYVRDPFYSGSLAGVTSFTGAAAQLNQIPRERLDPVAVAVMSLYPLPASPGLVGNYVSSPPNTMGINGGDGRLDQQLGKNDSMFLRYSYQFNNQFNASPFPGVADGGPNRPGTGYTESQNGALGWTHIFSPTIVNEARVGYSRVFDKRFQFDGNVMGIPGQFGIPGIPQISENGGLPQFTFGQLSNLGAGTFLPSDKASDVLQITENVTLDRGRNQIRTGFEIQHIPFPMATPLQPRGAFANSGIFTSVVNETDSSTDRAQATILPRLSPYSAAQNYLGEANDVQATNFPPVYYPIRNYFGIYVEDNLRATSNLTLNLGIRYEYIGSPYEKDGRLGNLVTAFSGDSTDGLSHYYVPKQQINAIPADFISLLNTNHIVLTPTPDNAIGIPQKANFAPRLGFSYQVSNKMVVRGGYGMFYEPLEQHGLSTAPYVSFPFQVAEHYVNQSAVEGIIADKTTNTTPEGIVGPINRGLANIPLTPETAPVTNLALNGEPRYPKTTYSQAYNLQVQYQFTPQTLLYAGYVGGNSRHVQTNLSANTTNVIAPPSTALSSIAFFPTLATGGSYVARAGASNYNSLQFGGEKRLSSGLSFLANMTWSKCMGDVHDLLDNGVGGYRAPYVAGMGIGADTTLCDTDVRRIVHVSGTYNLPFGHGRTYLQHGPASWLAGGWTMNWIADFQDGMPFSVACSKTTASGLGCFALKVPGQSLYGGPHNVNNFLNAAAFANPAPVASGTTGTIANLGGPGAQVTGPPFHRVDTSIFRQIPFVRESYFQFRLEVFNVLNTPNFGQPGSLNFTAPTNFAKITATTDDPNDPRIMQLALKYYF